MKVNPETLRTYELSRILSHVATEYDRKQFIRHKGRPGFYNSYALPQYFAAIDQTEKDHFDGKMTIREALVKNFTGRLLDAMLRAVNLSTSTDAEQRM